MNEINYLQLSDILKTLGFEKNIENSHIIFQHSDSNTTIKLPLAQDTDIVRHINIAQARFALDSKGLASQKYWEELIGKTQ